MSTTPLSAVPCSFVEVEHAPEQLGCDKCGELRPLVWKAERTALDLDLDRVGLLLVRVGVYRCSPCHHYFRSRPSFLGPDATYTNATGTRSSTWLCGDLQPEPSYFRGERPVAISYRCASSKAPCT